MKKRYLTILLIIIISFGGCQKSSDQFFSYKDYVSSTNIDLGIELSENNFFAENIVVLSDNEYSSQDDLVTSEAALLFDVTNNNVIYAKNPYERLYPASLTKLMTALVVLRRGELTDSVTVSNNAANIPVAGAKLCGFKEGDVISMDGLLHCLLIYSGNDAGIAIAEHMSKSEEEFVKLMNSEAKAIGASNTNFVNSHGLHDDNHYTTAYDMYLIFNELIQHDAFINIISQSSYIAVYKDIDKNEKSLSFNSTNLYLLGEKEAPETLTIIGGKTGLTYRAGNCLILLSKDSNNAQYVSVILKATDTDVLYSEMTKMLLFLTELN
ncbi:MAG: D-alanyl-D-alanine carboxypeptidase [Clostridiales bacterium]|nr:D-alanyl-D-alanine carboxypeptidase [Clostridiales bacterium]